MFGGLAADERVVKDLCGVFLPATFELKCLQRYPMTEQEAREEEERERHALEEEEDRRSRRRSRAVSRATSRTTSRTSSAHRTTVEDVTDTDDSP